MLRLSSTEVSAEDSCYEEVSLILIAVKVLILLYNHIQYGISQFPSVYYKLWFCFTTRHTIYSFFCFSCLAGTQFADWIVHPTLLICLNCLVRTLNVYRMRCLFIMACFFHHKLNIFLVQGPGLDLVFRLCYSKSCNSNVSEHLNI